MFIVFVNFWLERGLGFFWWRGKKPLTSHTSLPYSVLYQFTTLCGFHILAVMVPILMDELFKYSSCLEETKTVRPTISKISSTQVTGSYLSNILAMHGNDNGNRNGNDAHLAGHYYYSQRHRNSMQHFYRVKAPKGGKWFIEILHNPKCLEKRNSKNKKSGSCGLERCRW